MLNARPGVKTAARAGNCWVRRCAARMPNTWWCRKAIVLALPPHSRAAGRGHGGAGLPHCLALAGETGRIMAGESVLIVGA